MGGFHLFTLARIPVWVSPWFLAVPALSVAACGVRGGGVLALCIALSVLAHEFGHALMARRFDLGPQVVLHGFGGFTGHRRARTIGQDAAIVAAGPVAGLLLGLACFAALPSEQRSLVSLFTPKSPGADLSMLRTLAQLNLVWSAFNALPMIPLDGFRLVRLGLLKLLGKPARAELVSHLLGLASAFGAAFVTLRFPALFGESFVLLALLALVALRHVQGLATASRPPVRRDNPRARELVQRAEHAYRAGDLDEAARFCHMVRSEPYVPPQQLAHVWAMLGVIATRNGEFEEALSLLRRAPDADDVVEATAQCFYQLEMYDALSALTATKAFGRLPADTRDRILTALREVLPSA